VPDLTGRVAVVTGAARGLGRTIAHALYERGAAVAVVDIDLHSYRAFAGEADAMSADSTDAEIRAAGGQSLGYEVDLIDRAAVEAVMRSIVSDFGRLDVLVCNAGGGSGGVHENRAGSLDVDALRSMLDRNLLTTVNCCVAAVPALRVQGGGSIITMSSINGTGPTDDGAYAHYGVAKAAVAMYSRYLAHDLGPDGIRVNSIAPGTVPTGRLADVWRESGASPDTDRIALRRLPSPEEIARTVTYLAGDDSSYLTGQVITLDGGRA
jgi:3-oxoacyl-[acyl-carrier protein] reductase